MASHPPFQVEDQTDEDFFDKLVDDDDNIDFKGVVDSSVSSRDVAFLEGNESEEAKTFAKLSTGEVESDEKKGNDFGNGDLGAELGFVANGDVRGLGGCIEEVSVSGNVEGSNGSFIDGDPGLDTTVDANRENNSSPASSDCTVICKSGESGGSVIKEVGWGAFHNDDSAHDDSNGFGSYSEFFTDLGENDGSAMGNIGGDATAKARESSQSAYAGVANGYDHNQAGYGFGAAAEASGSSQSAYTGVSNNYDHNQAGYGFDADAEPSESSQSAYTGVSNGYDHNQAGYTYGSAAEQGNVVEHTNSSQYLEDLYPGWKFDPATGQWYEVDVNNFSTSVQGNLESNPASAWSFPDGKPEVSYLQNSAESVGETMAESGRTETATNLNQASQFSRVANQSQFSQEMENSKASSGWNQVSHADSAYPSHMVFDPQYPGWYYDTIAQEWRSLDSYTASSQSANQGQHQLNQNEFVGSNSYSHNDVPKTYANYNQVNQYGSSQSFSSHGQDYNWGGSLNSYNLPTSGVWEPERVIKHETVPNYSRNQQLENHYRQNVSETPSVTQQQNASYQGSYSNNGKVSQTQCDFPGVSRSNSFVSSENLTQFSHHRPEQNEQKFASNEYFGRQNLDSFPQQSFQSSQQYSYAPTPGKSSTGRPPHALVTFGFGGKLIIMKDNASRGNFSFASQNDSGYSMSILNMSEVITKKADAQSLQPGTCDYFHALCQQSFPGPLTGGNVGGKELNKWLDDRISSLEFSDMDIRERNALRHLLSLLIIACQHYGKLRSPFGTDPMLKENDLPGRAVAELFSSAKRNAAQHGAVAHCLQGLPSEAHLRATAAEVQSLLVSGKKTEALLCAQEGQLWGPALVLAAQLGNKFYVDTVKDLALRHLVAGSPLRTLCLLIAGQPADVFSADISASGGMPGVMSSPQQSMQLGSKGMLDDWEENLAVIASNRTKDDELVLIHLGDCLWRERADIFAAHICYLVAEANFEQYSDTARLCLVGADHLKSPRTYASPEAIQRTEIYEYSQVLGNSQFVLVPFQPYKLVYAHMLAEVGRVSDALKYCQAVQKSLKTGRSLEVETLRQVASFLEDRIKTHQQGGFSKNPVKLVGKLINFLNPVTTPVPSKLHEHPNKPMVPKVSTSQSTTDMSSLVPSTSMEPTTGDGSRRPMHNRSLSEPDFGRSPRQGQVDSTKDASSMSNQGKAASRFGRFGFGSQLFQKTVGLVLKPRQEHQAKLGDSNKFYYDEKLKRWVEEGAELPAQEAALPPPPPTSSFQGGTGTNYNLKTAARDAGNLSNGSPEYKSHTPIENSSGMPPLPPTSNQFSARGRMGVRSRYVDTFNQGGGNPTNLFSSPSVPSVRPAAGANPKFFVPAPVTSESRHDNVEGFSAIDENPSVSTVSESFDSRASISSVPMQRNPSMDNISSNIPTNGGTPFSPSRRTASWSGGLDDSHNSPKRPEIKPLGEVLGMPPSSFMPNGSRLMHLSVTRENTSVSAANRGSYGDELHEVEL